MQQYLHVFVDGFLCQYHLVMLDICCAQVCKEDKEDTLSKCTLNSHCVACSICDIHSSYICRGHGLLGC